MSINTHEIEDSLRLNWTLAEDILTRFIKTEVNRTGMNKVVIGVSGGVDSALSCMLGVKALGKDNVFALIMPYKDSAVANIEDSEKFCKALNIEYRKIDITPLSETYFKSNPDMSRVRRGNFLARLRMALLFDVSAEKSALVLGTGNKTEALLGYTTWYGDSACSLNPIGDLYKTQVWDFAAYLEIPQRIIDKAPSADLWPGQTDEDEMGLDYPAADKILHRLADLRLKPDEIIRNGFKEEIVKKVVSLVKRYQFKRMTPLIAKISPRTVGSDFIYSRDWGV
ncbi:NAD+ synthase [bacterium]|nr:NAD+ synthase [bacterium]